MMYHTLEYIRASILRLVYANFIYSNFMLSTLPTLQIVGTCSSLCMFMWNGYLASTWQCSMYPTSCPEHRSYVGEGPSLCLWGWPWPCRYFGASDFGCWVAVWPDASGVGRLAATVWCCSYFWGTSSREASKT